MRNSTRSCVAKSHIEWPIFTHGAWQALKITGRGSSSKANLQTLLQWSMARMRHSVLQAAKTSGLTSGSRGSGTNVAVAFGLFVEASLDGLPNKNVRRSRTDRTAATPAPIRCCFSTWRFAASFLFQYLSASESHILHRRK